MSYTPSVNIEYEAGNEFNYIVTPNAQSVLGNIVTSYQSGFHSFTIIGTYGTGKSSFIMAFERDLRKNGGELLRNSKVFNADGFEFINIVGDYAPLSSLLSRKLNSDTSNIFTTLGNLCQSLKKQNKFLLVAIDEFGKILEHAANHNPEQELYFLQKLAEFANVPTRRIILLTTLHQNFSAYASKLTETQKNEWSKVKGRFKEVVFVEPVEQLLYLAARQLGKQSTHKKTWPNSKDITHLAKEYRIISKELEIETINRLYPLDAISSACLTLGIQRYGQNERTLFSFLTAEGNNSVRQFKASSTLTYNTASVYDYLVYSFFTALAEANADSMDWRAMRVAVERVESGIIDSDLLSGCLKIVKTIGLLNLFFKQIKIDDRLLRTYAKLALNIEDAQPYLAKLIAHKIIRFANYKQQYVLFEGTDVDIEDELYKASLVVPVPNINVNEILPFANQKAILASSIYYRVGTPRYFEYKITNDLVETAPTGDIDGFINLVFPIDLSLSDAVSYSAGTDSANIYVFFNNADEIVRHLHELKKLQYILDNVIIDDRVARREVTSQLQHEANLLNICINENLTANNGAVTWIFRGKAFPIESAKDINRLLSEVCEEVYHQTPIIKNELFNRQKLSSAISLARVTLLDAMLAHNGEKDFGIAETAFPPEKTIYYTLFHETGIHRMDDDGMYYLDEPTTDGIMPLWNECCRFLESSVEKEQKLTTLIKTLKEKPFKLKQGVIDFWLPIFLFVKQQSFALYNGSTFVLDINKEVFELLQKRPGDFSVRAYDVSGVKLQFFKKYRQFLRQSDEIAVSSDSVLATIKPFFNFYRRLNDYAKSTRKFNNSYTAKFRDILAEAKDPAKAFFEDIPKAFGYSDMNDDEFVRQYVDLIRSAVQELNACYDSFIGRVEQCVKRHLGFAEDVAFDEYKLLIDNRYRTINKSLLAQKPRAFIDRVLSPSNSKREFYEKIGQVVYDRRLETIKDAEEERFIYDLLFLFSEAERFITVSSAFDENTDIAFSFELAASNSSFNVLKTYALPKTKRKAADNIAKQLANKLSGDRDLDICVLLKLLNERL